MWMLIRRGMSGPTILLFLLFAGAVAPSAAQTVAEKEQELARVSQQISEITRAVQESQSRRDDAVNDLSAAERHLGQAASGVREAEHTMEEIQAYLAELDIRRLDIEADLSRERSALAAQVRAAYRYGRQERLKLLLMQDDPAAVGRVLAYYDALNRVRANRIRRVESQAQALDEVQDQIVVEQRRHRASRETLESELAALAEAREARRVALAEIDQRLQLDSERLARLQNDARELHELIGALQEAMRQSTRQAMAKSFPDMKGSLPWPIGGKVKARYGDVRPIGEAQWHGLLIEAPEGRQVKAIHPGRVMFADWLRGYGLLVILDHGNDYLSVYAHNQSVFPGPGDQVAQGEVIATVGNSGGLEQDGLYFEIRRHGQPINPAGWLTRR